MGELVNHVNPLGLTFGIYTDSGTRTCGKRPGSFGHETADAELFVRNLSISVS
jgi:alpha-galactosidase